MIAKQILGQIYKSASLLQLGAIKRMILFKMIAVSLVINLLLPISAVAAANSTMPEPLFEGIPLACYVYNAKSSTGIEGSTLDQAMSLVEISAEYNKSKQFDRAKQTLAVGLNYAQNSLSSDRDKSYTLVQIAKNLAQAEDKTQAITVLTKAEELLPAIFGRDRIFALLTISDGYLKVDDQSKAVALLDQVISSANDLEDKYAKGRILAEAAQVYSQIPNFKVRAKEILDQDLQLSNSFSNPSAAARIQLEIATNYAKQGETEAANSAIKTAIATLQKNSAPQNKTESTKNPESSLVEAIAYDYLSSAYLSVQNFDQAQVIIDQMPDSFNKTIQLSQIANLQLAAKKNKEAEKNIQRSLEIAKDLEDPARTIEALSPIAVAYQKLGQTTKAVEQLKQSVNLALRTENTADKVAAFIAIANTFDRIGQNNRAIQALDQAYEIAIQAERESEKPILIAAVTGAYGQVKDYNRALDIARGTADLPARNQLMRLYECAAEVTAKAPLHN